MSRTIAAVFVAITLSFAAGCGTTGAPVSPKIASAGCVPHDLAPGVALCISAGASPDAREAAERLETEYRDTYLNAR
jgi:hypothetical protein